jgi:hypothetical protein
MKGAHFSDLALALHAEISRKFNPTPDGFENLTFLVQPDRVVVWDWQSADLKDMAVVHYRPVRARYSSSGKYSPILRADHS